MMDMQQAVRKVYAHTMSFGGEWLEVYFSDDPMKAVFYEVKLNKTVIQVVDDGRLIPNPTSPTIKKFFGDIVKSAHQLQMRLMLKRFMEEFFKLPAQLDGKHKKAIKDIDDELRGCRDYFDDLDVAVALTQRFSKAQLSVIRDNFTTLISTTINLNAGAVACFLQQVVEMIEAVTEEKE